MIPESQLRELMVRPGKKAKLDRRDAAWTFTEKLADGNKDQLKEEARQLLDKNRAELAQAQDVLFAAGTHAVLVILQGMDAAGKDGTVKHVMSGVNPQGCDVTSFKQPSAEERSHDFLWRYSKRLPARGVIGIFNRSYYEEVLVVRVHPEFLGPARPAGNKGLKAVWKARYDDINAFERHLTRCGTLVLKLFLHLSKAEQKKRLLERVKDPTKRWKFSADDLQERARWDDYLVAYEKALTATSTEWAPWYVVPADHKWVARTVVAEVVSRAIRALDLRYPDIPPEQEAELKAAQQALEQE